MSRYAAAGFGYLQQVEAYFLGLTQVGVMLSARDLELVCAWRDSGVPVETVCRGLKDAFDRYESPPRSVWHCRKVVEVEVSSWRARTAGAHGAQEVSHSTVRQGRRLRDPTRVRVEPDTQEPADVQMPVVWTRSLARLERAGADAEFSHVKEAFRSAWRQMKALCDEPDDPGVAMAIFAIEAEFFDEVFDGLTHVEQHQVDSQLSPSRLSALKTMSAKARREQLRVWRRPMLAAYGAVAFFEP